MAGAVACFEIEENVRELCIRMPGGTRICASPPGVIVPTPDELAQMLMGQLNTALAPINPIFDVINAIFAIKDTLTAVATLDIPTIVESLETLSESISGLLSVLPAASVPLMMLDIITTLLMYIQGILSKLEAMAAQQTRIAEARALAIEQNLTELLTTVECAEDQLASLMDGIQSSAGPIGNILALVNNLGSLAGLPAIEFDFGSGDLQETIDTLNELMTTLLAIREAIPV